MKEKKGKTISYHQIYITLSCCVLCVHTPPSTYFLPPPVKNKKSFGHTFSI
jgi:hypothetical protein